MGGLGGTAGEGSRGRIGGGAGSTVGRERGPPTDRGASSCVFAATPCADPGVREGSAS